MATHPSYITQAATYARSVEELAAVCTTKHATEVQLKALNAVASLAPKAK
jgi:hypothetical protein